MSNNLEIFWARNIILAGCPASYRQKNEKNDGNLLEKMKNDIFTKNNEKMTYLVQFSFFVKSSEK